MLTVVLYRLCHKRLGGFNQEIALRKHSSRNNSVKVTECNSYLPKTVQQIWVNFGTGSFKL